MIARQPLQAPALYRAFAARLTPHDIVLTFNYDTLLEQALDEIEKPYTLTPEWWLDSDPTAAHEPKFINVIKLHGSVDWYDRRHYENDREYFATLPVEVPDKDPLFGPGKRVPTESLSRGTVSGYGH